MGTSRGLGGLDGDDNAYDLRHRNGSADQVVIGGGGPSGPAYLQEPGSGYYQTEDGSGVYLLE